MKTSFKFECPHCAQRISASPEAAGTVGICPACEGQFTVPDPVREESAAPASSVAVPPPLPPSSAASEAPSPAVSSPPKRGFFTGAGTLLITILAGMAAKHMVNEMFGLKKPSSRSSFQTQMDKIQADQAERRMIEDLREGKYGLVPQLGSNTKPPETFDPRLGKAPADGWQQRNVAGVTLELPGLPRIKSFTVPPEAKALIEKMEKYELMSGESLIGIGHVHYAVGSADLDGAASGAIEGMRNQTGTSDFSSTGTNLSIDGIPARKSTVRYRRSGIEVTSRLLTVARDRDVWSIMVVGLAAEPPDLAERVFASAHLAP